MTPETWLKYKLYRQDETVRAQLALTWARNHVNKQKRAFIHALPYTNEMVYQIIPGIGTLIIKECRYWRSVAKGDTCFVGYVVTLISPEDTTMEEDSCWGYGYEYDSKDTYLLGCMNDAAQGMVEKHWKQLYGELPPAFVAGIDPTVDAAWKAWHTAMATSDGDRDIADPIFVSIIGGDRGPRRLRAERLVQVRA